MHTHNKTDVKLAVIDGKPTFTAVLDGSWKMVVTREYRAHKILTDAETNEVVGHAFLVEVQPYGEACHDFRHDHENPCPLPCDACEDECDPELREVLGATYQVWEVSVNSRPTCRHYGDRANLNNYEFAYLDFIRTFGHHIQADEKMLDGMEAANNATDLF